MPTPGGLPHRLIVSAVLVALLSMLAAAMPSQADHTRQTSNVNGPSGIEAAVASVVDSVVKPCVIASFKTLTTSLGIVAKDSVMYVAGNSGGLFIYGTRYGGPPVFLSGLNTTGATRDVDLSENIVAIADKGVWLIDVTDPTFPIPLSNYYRGFSVERVLLDDSILYAAGYPRVDVINIANPSAPDSIATLAMPPDINTRGLHAENDRLYVTGERFGLYVFDISNPESPSLLGHNDFGEAYVTWDVDSKGDTAYVATRDGAVLCVNASNPASMTVFATIWGEDALDVKRRGRQLYVADGSHGVRIYDLATPLLPTLVAAIPPPAGALAHGLYVDTGRVYFACTSRWVTMAALSIQGEHWCGNGALESSEYCDDSNLVVGDGCTACCLLDPPMAVCGNGQIEYPETCDDGNLVSGDGCDPLCQREPAICGNGLMEYPELCDDGNADAHDGCDNCDPAPLCGDGSIASTEECDDGNRISGDGCDSDCQCEDICGNLVVAPCEECDDGNSDPFDGCDNCHIFCLITVNGDMNNSNTATSADIITLVHVCFKGGPPPLPCMAAGDVDCSGAVTAGDIITLVNFIFKGGLPPCEICRNSPLAATCL